MSLLLRCHYSAAIWRIIVIIAIPLKMHYGGEKLGQNIGRKYTDRRTNLLISAWAMFHPSKIRS